MSSPVSFSISRPCRSFIHALLPLFSDTRHNLGRHQWRDCIITWHALCPVVLSRCMGKCTTWIYVHYTLLDVMYNQYFSNENAM